MRFDHTNENSVTGCTIHHRNVDIFCRQPVLFLLFKHLMAFRLPRDSACAFLSTYPVFPSPPGKLTASPLCMAALFIQCANYNSARMRSAGLSADPNCHKVYRGLR